MIIIMKNAGSAQFQIRKLAHNSVVGPASVNCYRFSISKHSKSLTNAATVRWFHVGHVLRVLEKNNIDIIMYSLQEHLSLIMYNLLPFGSTQSAY